MLLPSNKRTLSKELLLSPRQRKRQVEQIESFLRSLVKSFFDYKATMFIDYSICSIEQQKEHEDKVSKKYIDLNAQWKNFCHKDKYKHIKTNLKAFEINIDIQVRKLQGIKTNITQHEETNKRAD